MRNSFTSTAAVSFIPPSPALNPANHDRALDQTDWVRWDDQPYWSAWSRASVRLMQTRNAALVRELGLQGRSYRWSLKSPFLVFTCASGQVVADICVIGCASATEGTFLWAWANDTIPAQARRGLERVREFGEMNGLDLMTTPEIPASRSQAFELAAVGARILNAAAVWVETSGELTLFFALSNARPA